MKCVFERSVYSSVFHLCVICEWFLGSFNRYSVALNGSGFVIGSATEYKCDSAYGIQWVCE